jgi:hypothetical protein
MKPVTKFWSPSILNENPPAEKNENTDGKINLKASTLVLVKMHQKLLIILIHLQL